MSKNLEPLNSRMAVLAAQPESSDGLFGPMRSFPNDVTIRTMRADDYEFAGNSLISAFESKFTSIAGAQ